MDGSSSDELWHVISATASNENRRGAIEGNIVCYGLLGTDNKYIVENIN